jgi:hypothetical protein
LGSQLTRLGNVARQLLEALVLEGHGQEYGEDDEEHHDGAGDALFVGVPQEILLDTSVDSLIVRGDVSLGPHFHHRGHLCGRVGVWPPDLLLFGFH